MERARDYTTILYFLMLLGGYSTSWLLEEDISDVAIFKFGATTGNALFLLVLLVWPERERWREVLFSLAALLPSIAWLLPADSFRWLLLSVAFYATGAVLIFVARNLATKEKGYPEGILGGFFMTPLAPFLWLFLSSTDWLYGVMVGEIMIKYALVWYLDRRTRRSSA